MKKLFLVSLLAIALTSCEVNTTQQTQTQASQESNAFKKGKRQLKTMGYTQIKEVSYPFFCCSDDDSILYSTGFEAVDSDGEKVTGCMCGGFAKGITIRFN